MATLGRALWIPAVAILVFCIEATAQNLPAPQQGHDCVPGDGSVCITKEQLNPLEPTPGGKFWRALQYQYQFGEQPAFVVASTNNANGSMTTIIPNPEKYLNQHTLSFQFSEIFPATSNLASMVAALYAVNKDPKIPSQPLRLANRLCKSTNQIECLVSGGNFWERFLSGVSGNVSLAERDPVQQGVSLTLTSSQHYGAAGEVDFDPSLLFVTGTNWQTVLTALKDVNLEPERFFGDDATCFVKGNSSPEIWQNCVTEFSRSRFSAYKKQGALTKIGAALIPKFQFKATSQFDFLKNGGVLVPEPGLQRSLKNYSFTWDLRHAIASTSDRVAALKAYKGYSQPQASDGTQAKMCVTGSGASKGYVPVGSGFTADNCRRLAKDAQAGLYALACATSSGVSIGPAMNPDISQDPKTPDSNTCNW